MDLSHLIMIAVGVLAAAFLVLFSLAVMRRARPEGQRLWRWGSGALALAGLLFILAGFVGKGDMTFVVCGFMFLVFATGTELAPGKGKKAPKA